MANVVYSRPQRSGSKPMSIFGGQFGVDTVGNDVSKEYKKDYFKVGNSGKVRQPRRTRNNKGVLPPRVDPKKIVFTIKSIFSHKNCENTGRLMYLVKVNELDDAGSEYPQEWIFKDDWVTIPSFDRQEVTYRSAASTATSIWPAGGSDLTKKDAFICARMKAHELAEAIQKRLQEYISGK